MNRFSAGPVQRGRGAVPGLRLFLVGFGGGVIVAGVWGERRRWVESVAVVELGGGGGGGGGEVAREEIRSGGIFLAGEEASEKGH